jgi:hypothetical protein
VTEVDRVVLENQLFATFFQISGEGEKLFAKSLSRLIYPSLGFVVSFSLSHDFKIMRQNNKCLELF